MAKKSTYQLKQLIPEEKPETGTKYIVRKPTKGMKVSDNMLGELSTITDNLLVTCIQLIKYNLILSKGL